MRFLSDAGTNNAITDIAGNRGWVPTSPSSLALHGMWRHGRHRGFDNRRSLQCIVIEKTRIQFGCLSSWSKRYFVMAAVESGR